MPGYLLDMSSTVLCMHGGQAQATVPAPRVRINGQPAVTIQGPYVIAGCAMPPPPTGNGPCVTATWVMGASRVLANGAPVLLQDSQAVCTPTGTGLNVVLAQTRVKGM